MPKKRGKKKDKATEVDSDVEIISRTEIIFKDTKSSIGADQEIKWGEIYQMIRDQNVLDAGLEDISLYDNIRKSDITKESYMPRAVSMCRIHRLYFTPDKPYHDDYFQYRGRRFCFFHSSLHN